ncbi:MAG: hypothetical protein ACPHIT_05630, partial [Flavobacteriaceae bacterium]
MKFSIYSCFLVLCSGLLFSQHPINEKDSLAITAILFQQQEDWNKGAIDAFMEGYLNSNELVFSGA